MENWSGRKYAVESKKCIARSVYICIRGTFIQRTRGTDRHQEGYIKDFAGKDGATRQNVAWARNQSFRLWAQWWCWMYCTYVSKYAQNSGRHRHNKINGVLPTYDLDIEEFTSNRYSVQWRNKMVVLFHETAKPEIWSTKPSRWKEVEFDIMHTGKQHAFNQASNRHGCTDASFSCKYASS
jgi:hypothetical protein